MTACKIFGAFISEHDLEGMRTKLFWDSVITEMLSPFERILTVSAPDRLILQSYRKSGPFVVAWSVDGSFIKG